MKFIKAPNYRSKDNMTEAQKLQINLGALMVDAPVINDDLETDFWFSDDGNLFMNKYRVLYGYRLRAGFMRLFDCCSELDICCGAQQKDYESMQKKIRTIIENNPKDNPFKDIPRVSRIKPYFNDDEFIDTIDSLYEKALSKQKELIRKLSSSEKFSEIEGLKMVRNNIKSAFDDSIDLIFDNPEKFKL